MSTLVKCGNRGFRDVYSLFFEIDGTGTASITSGAADGTLTDNGTGNYTVTFTVPFQKLLGVSVIVVGAATAGALVPELVTSAYTGASVQITINSDAGALTDAKFLLRVDGSYDA